MIPIIKGDIRDIRNYSGGIPFTNLAPISDDNLASAVPDIYYGAVPELVDRSIHDELGHLIAPSTQTDLQENEPLSSRPLPAKRPSRGRSTNHQRKRPNEANNEDVRIISQASSSASNRSIKKKRAT